jgi:hypothetical protein
LLRRKLAKLCGTRRAVLYPFDPTRLYKNLLLIPKERLAVLEQLQPGVDSPLGRDV